MYYTSNWTGNYTGDMEMYDLYSRRTNAILTVVFPPANTSSVASIGESVAFWSCVRPTHFSADSRLSPLLPAGTPITVPMSKREKVGLGVGVTFGIVGLIAIAVAAWLFLRRRRRSREFKRRQTEDAAREQENGAELLEKERGELLGGGADHEMEGSRRQAKESAGRQIREVEGNLGFWEMEGQAHHEKNGGRVVEIG